MVLGKGKFAFYITDEKSPHRMTCTDWIRYELLYDYIQLAELNFTMLSRSVYVAASRCSGLCITLLSWVVL